MRLNVLTVAVMVCASVLLQQAQGLSWRQVCRCSKACTKWEVPIKRCGPKGKLTLCCRRPFFGRVFGGSFPFIRGSAGFSRVRPFMYQGVFEGRSMLNRDWPGITEGLSWFRSGPYRLRGLPNVFVGAPLLNFDLGYGLSRRPGLVGVAYGGGLSIYSGGLEGVSGSYGRGLGGLSMHRPGPMIGLGGGSWHGLGRERRFGGGSWHGMGTGSGLDRGSLQMNGFGVYGSHGSGGVGSEYGGHGGFYGGGFSGRYGYDDDDDDNDDSEWHGTYVRKSRYY